MKKISLKNLNLNEVEKMSRSQLKNILGGYSGETTVPTITEVTTTEPPCHPKLNQSCITYGGGTHGGSEGQTYTGTCVIPPWGPTDCSRLICIDYASETQSYTCD